MHLLTALSLKNRALIALVTVVAAVFGVIGVGSLKQELMPSVQFPAIAVITTYSGASPEVVNTDVSGPIETALRGVPNLESTTATSSTGSSMVLAQFKYGVDIAATEQKVERAVSRISALLPESADTQVMAGSLDDFPVIQIAVAPAPGETAEQAASVIDRVVIPELSDLDGVRDAQLTGASANRITIEPRGEDLAAQGLSPQAVSDTVQQSGLLMAAGTVADGDRTLAVQAGSAVATVDDVIRLPITGSTATIGDVADVRLEPNPVASISRVNGAPSLTIAIIKTPAANTVEVSHAVQDTLDELQEQLGGATLTVIFDQAPYIEQSIETLTTEGLLGLLFAVLVILVFLMSVRATLVTAISIPTSVLLTFVGLNFADYTLNLLTLGALTISIGRVVDDSIVVIENIKRHLTQGSDRTRTIVRAVREVAGAITASTITTVAVFLPMAFVSGMVGELFRPFAFTVTIALVASLLVSLTIVPVLAYWFLKPSADASADADSAAPAADTWLQRGYRPIIEWTLRGKGPAITLIAALAVFAGTMAATPLMKTNYLGDDGQNSIALTQTLAPGTSLDAQLAQAERVELALADLDGIETLQVTIGSAGGAAALFGGGGDGSLSYSITADEGADATALQERIRTAVEGLEDAGEFSLGQSSGGVTGSSSIAVSVAAPDQATLAQASDAVLAQLQQLDELQQVESDLSQSRPFLRVAVDRAAAAGVGLSETAVAAQLAQQMQPQQIGQITLDATTTAVYLTSGAAPADQAGVAALPIQTAVGPMTLDQLATIEVTDGPVTVSTQDGVRVVTVSALPKSDDLSTAGVQVAEALETVELPVGATASVGGVMAQQTEAFEQLGLALLAAILIVYVVMVATFRSLLQPLLLLISVPFAATGALLLLIATGIPLGVASLIGVLMLIGIVVTNAIVLVDLVNQYRDRGSPLREAVLNGSMQRLRPIVMTALATILALTPMGLGITGKGGFISQPLAVVVIGGLLSSTVLTLVVLPTLYYVVERARERARDRARVRRGGLVNAIEAEAHGVTSNDAQPDVVDRPRRRGARRATRLAATTESGQPLGAAAAVGVLGTAGHTISAHADDTTDALESEQLGETDAAIGEHVQPAQAEVTVPKFEQSDVAEVAAAEVIAPELVQPADAETQQRILEQLMRAGLAAPEYPIDASMNEPSALPAVEPEEPVSSGSADSDDLTGATAAVQATERDGEQLGHDDDVPFEPVSAHSALRVEDTLTPEAALPAAPIELPEPPTDELDRGPSTAKMAEALGELGFVGEHDPLRDDDDELGAGPFARAPKASDELQEPDWDELMWQATQEVEQAEQDLRTDDEDGVK